MNSIATVTSTDLTLAADTSEIALAEQASRIIELLENAHPDRAKEIRDDAEAFFEVLRRRGWALDAINPIAEVKITAERRIGLVRSAIPRDYTGGGGAPSFDWEKAKKLLEAGLSTKETARLVQAEPASIRHAKQRGFKRSRDGQSLNLSDFDKKLGLGKGTGRTWQRLAQIPDELFERYVREIKDDGLELTTARVLYRAGIDNVHGRGQRVEPGIFLLNDGRYVIRYRYRGRTQQETLQTKHIAVARRTLLHRRGLLKETAKSRNPRLDNAYSNLRTCLDHIDKVLPTLKPEARKHAHDTISLLHQAEDELTKAIRVEG